MPKLKAKSKAKSKSKSAKKSKSTVKTKQLKSKSKSKTKAKTKLKAKPKYKAKVKAKSKAKAKKPTKSKLKKKTTVKKSVKKTPKQAPKSKALKKPKTNILTQTLNLTETQKAMLLDTIKQILDLRRETTYGLKSMDTIDRILDQYNQKYTDTHKKFEAVVNFGIEEHAKYTSNSGLIAFKDNGRDAILLYKLLSDLGNGNVDFSEAKDELNSIYEDSLVENA